MGYGVKYAEKLRSYGIDAALKTCIYLQENGITVSLWFKCDFVYYLLNK